MKFTNINLLNDVVLDYQNPYKIYKLAREYDRLEQGAGAFSWYLRAADMANSDESPQSVRLKRLTRPEQNTHFQFISFLYHWFRPEIVSTDIL